MATTLTYELLVDKNERPNKCTILPLDYRDDFAIRRVDLRGPLPRLTADLLLHMDGEPLDELAARLRAEGALAAVGRIALIDCVWRRCAKIAALIERPLPRLARIPEGFLTAYPRRNRDNLDPEGGLATIEALFIAAAFFGVWDETLLKEYHFGPAFLEMNRGVFARYGLGGSGSGPAV